MTKEGHITFLLHHYLGDAAITDIHPHPTGGLRFEYHRDKITDQVPVAYNDIMAVGALCHLKIFAKCNVCALFVL